MTYITYKGMCVHPALVPDHWDIEAMIHALPGWAMTPLTVHHPTVCASTDKPCSLITTGAP